MDIANYKSRFYNAYKSAYPTIRPFGRDAYWFGFFDTLAERLVAEIAPHTALDAGCATGFLVEALRQRGVDAWGMDPSEAAIDQVHPDIKPYCQVSSLSSPLERRFDIIICVELLEHKAEEDAKQVINNICQATDDILFSSTPPGFQEKTAINIKPPEYWSELFLSHGFVRDLEFDTSFFAPWSTRFRKGQRSLADTVSAYEHRFWLFSKENTELHRASMETANFITAAESEIQSQKLIIENLTKKEQHLSQILSSRSWQLIQKFQKFRQRLIPLESRRERWMNLGIRALQVLFNEGIRPFFRLAYWKIRSMEDYQLWLKWTEARPEELESQRRKALNFSYRPLVSILTPVYNPPPHVLREMIESVLAQTYDHWELCLVDGASEKTVIADILKAYTIQDHRITVDFLKSNRGISENTNIAIERAAGEFVALVDHDDVISPTLLFEVAGLLNQKPDTDLIYFDEDKLSPDGDSRRDPLFKPDWSPEMLLSANYLTHPVIRKSLVEDAGCFDPAMDGAQDWDLMLRCSERTQKIEHIPKVLYHWRQISGSTAARHTAKPWVFERQLTSVKNHLQRLSITGVEASFTKPGFLRVVWPTSGSKVSIIIPTKDKLDYLQRCIHSLLHLTEYPDYEIILVDTGSQDLSTLRYYDGLANERKVRIINFTGEFNYSAANNLGAQMATGDIFLFLNNDTEVLEMDWLEELARWVEHPGVGIVGTKLLYPDNTIQHAGVIVGLQGHASHIFWGAQERQGTIFGSVDWYRNYMAVTGACMMTRRSLFEEIGGFNEDYLLTFSDIEFCIRAYQKGYRIVYTPYARLRHHEGRSRGDFIPANDILVGYAQFREFVQAGDPYFNPNLSYAPRMPSLRPKGEENRLERLERIVRLRTEGTVPDNH